MKTPIIKIDPEYPEAKDISYCSKIIRKGGLVIFPTETVYGIAADFTNPKAIARLYEVKQRPADKRFAVLVPQKELVSNYTPYHEPVLYKLIDKFWPGPLTIIVPKYEEGETIGMRMPNNLIALKLVIEAQTTIAAPSANISGKPAPTTCAEALADFDGLVDAAIDGGAAKIGTSSTVVSLLSEKPTVQREGVISQKDIDKVANTKTILFVCSGNSCRSVMAEYLLKERMKKRDDIEVLSAGTGVFVHSTASAETIAVLKDEKIDASNHESQPINTIMLKRADLILVMTKTHRYQVLERVPEVEKRIYLLREFANIPANFEGDLDIPDPIGRSHGEYKECLSIIKESIDKIAKLI